MNEDYKYAGPDGHEQNGPDASIAVGRLFATAFPDGRLEVDRTYVAGDVVISEMTGRGMHTGDFLGIAPTNRQIVIKICNVMEIRNGKASREREYFDMASVLAQLGVSKLPAQMAGA